MDRYNKYQTKRTRTSVHAHTSTMHTHQMVASTCLGVHQGKLFAPTNSLDKLHMARYQVLLHITLHSTDLTNRQHSTAIDWFDYSTTFDSIRKHATAIHSIWLHPRAFDHSTAFDSVRLTWPSKSFRQQSTAFDWFDHSSAFDTDSTNYSIRQLSTAFSLRHGGTRNSLWGIVGILWPMMSAMLTVNNYLVTKMDRFIRYQTKQYKNILQQCTHTRWLLVLSWVTTKKDCPRLQIV